MPRELLVLDEPTNGLDPQGTREVRSLVRSLAAEGTTVFVSSHLLAEVEQICTHAAVMSAGKLVAQGTVDELRQVGLAHVKVQTPDTEDARRVLQRLGLAPEVLNPNNDGGSTVRAPLADHAVEPESIVAALVAEGVRVRGFTVESSSLEERFVALTGEGFDIVQ
jgi:ABC-2 type transport system ATP-binding protein